MDRLAADETSTGAKAKFCPDPMSELKLRPLKEQIEDSTLVWTLVVRVYGFQDAL